MRARRILASALLFLLASCGNEAGPKPRGQAQDPGIEGLRTKVTAVSVDQCFVTPSRQLPKGCEKYVTELASTPDTVRKVADTKNPDLTAQADKLAKGIAAYRANACNTVDTPASQPCSGTLADIAAALGAIKAFLATRATTG